MLAVYENDNWKAFRSSVYNYNFNKHTGYFERWGRTFDDDPNMSIFGPEIVDIEITSTVNDNEEVPKDMLITNGGCRGNCSFCYKGHTNSKRQIHMTLITLKGVLDKLPITITQIAFGICDIDSHPQFFEILEETRNRGIVPNFTNSGVGVTWNLAKRTAELCGAVAVSVNMNHPVVAYEAINKFTNVSDKLQVNIHYMLSEETYDGVFQLIKDIKELDLLKQFKGAIVFLCYKDKQNNPNYHSVRSIEKYKRLIEDVQNNGINIGFDSCSAQMYLATIKGSQDEYLLSQYVELCESGLFSAYINCKGKYFPCSFSECMPQEWETGIDIIKSLNFMKDIWYNKRTVKWRKRLLNRKRSCPIYQLEPV
jgi:hypothetical protein